MHGRKIGALAIITGMVIPWLVYGSIKVFSHDTDIAVIRSKLKEIVKSQERIENKVDTMYNYIIKGE